MNTTARPLRDLARLMRSIEDEEGFRGSPYRDTEGLWSFAIGVCLERSPISGEMWRILLDRGMVTLKVSHEGAVLISKAKLEQLATALSERFPRWFEIAEPRRHVLMHMGYQMGLEFIEKFPLFVAAVNAGDWPAAKAHGLDSLWARKQTPARAARLMDKLEAGVW